MLERGDGEDGDGSTVLLLSLTPRFSYPAQSSELVFLVDCSGSMQGESIRLASEALQLFLHSLPVDSFFNIVCFGTSYQPLFSPESRHYDDVSLAAAKQLARRLAANRGGTDIYEPLERVLRQRHPLLWDAAELVRGHAKHAAFIEVAGHAPAMSGEDRYRRGLYTFFWRATPFPALVAFDAPNAIQACTRRNRSNTPLQALTLLNDASYMECASALATRIDREEGTSDAKKIERLFKLALARKPTADEETTVLALVSAERNDAPANQSDGRSNPWLAAARVILNTDEFITRE